MPNDCLAALVYPQYTLPLAGGTYILASPDCTQAFQSRLVFYSSLTADLEYLKKHMMLWEKNARPMYALRGVAMCPLTQQVLASLIAVGSSTSRHRPQSPAEEAILCHLESASLAEREADGWQLTARAWSSIDVLWQLQHPAPIASVRSNVEWSARTGFELLQLLRDGGWTAAALPKRLQARLDLKWYKHGEEKRWYIPRFGSGATTATSTYKSYWQCLLRAEDTWMGQQ